MTTIILVIIGILLAAAAVLFVIYYGGDAFGNGHIEAEAARLVGEGAQMEAALELHYRQEGHYPMSDDPVAELIAAGYLDYQPLGTRTTESDRWAINYDAGMILARLGTTESEESSSICLKARQQLDLPAANTATGIYRCDGTDSPGGKLSGREPCCIGEVSAIGGPKSPPPPAKPVLVDNSTSSCANYLIGASEYITAMIARSDGSKISNLGELPGGDPGFEGFASCGIQPIDFLDENSGAYLFRAGISRSLCDAVSQKTGNPRGINTNYSSCGTYYGNEQYMHPVQAVYNPLRVARIKSEAKRFYDAAKTSPVMPSPSNIGITSDFGGWIPTWTMRSSSNGGRLLWAGDISPGTCEAVRAANGRESFSSSSYLQDTYQDDCGVYWGYRSYAYQLADAFDARLLAALMNEETGNYTTTNWYSDHHVVPLRVVGVTAEACYILKRHWKRPINLSLNTNLSQDCGTFWGNTVFMYHS